MIRCRQKKPDSRSILEKIIRYVPLKHEDGKFIPFCDNYRHQGIVSKDYYKICEKKSKGHPCRYYIRLFIPEDCALNGNGRNGCK